jgi:hypothetical protein
LIARPGSLTRRAASRVRQFDICGINFFSLIFRRQRGKATLDAIAVARLSPTDTPARVLLSLLLLTLVITRRRR